MDGSVATVDAMKAALNKGVSTQTVDNADDIAVKEVIARRRGRPGYPKTQCKFCKDFIGNQGLERHKRTCLFNPERQNPENMDSCPKCGILLGKTGQYKSSYNNHVKGCNGNMIHAVKASLAKDRSYYAKVKGIDARQIIMGETEMPSYIRLRQRQLLVQRGMPQEWNIKEIEHEYYGKKNNPKNGGEVKRSGPLGQRPAKKSQPKIAVTTDLDALFELMAEHLGMKKLLSSLDEFKDWQDITTNLWNA